MRPLTAFSNHKARDLTHPKVTLNTEPTQLPADDETDADVIAEPIDAEMHAPLAEGMGRIVAWLIDGGTLRRIGERAMVMTYKVRPDLVGGITIREMAKQRRVKKSYVAKLAKQFTRTFGFRGINDHAGRPCARLTDRKRHGGGRAGPQSLRSIIQRFREWQAEQAAGTGAASMTLAERQKLLRLVGPMRDFVHELQRTVDEEAAGGPPYPG